MMRAVSALFRVKMNLLAALFLAMLAICIISSDAAGADIDAIRDMIAEAEKQLAVLKADQKKYISGEIEIRIIEDAILRNADDIGDYIKKNLKKDLDNFNIDGQLMAGAVQELSEITARLKNKYTKLAKYSSTAVSNAERICKHGYSPDIAVKNAVLLKNDAEALHRAEKDTEDDLKLVKMRAEALRDGVLRIKETYNSVLRPDESKLSKIEKLEKDIKEGWEVRLTLLTLMENQKDTLRKLETIKGRIATAVSSQGRSTPVAAEATEIQERLNAAIRLGEIITKSSVPEFAYMFPEVAKDQLPRARTLRKNIPMFLKEVEQEITDNESVISEEEEKRAEAEKRLAEARDCIGKAEETTTDKTRKSDAALKDEAWEAIKACQLDRAKHLMDRMQEGPWKDTLREKYDEVNDSEQKIRKLVDSARVNYSDCDYDNTGKLLHEALQNSYCKKHSESILQKLKATSNAQALRIELQEMVAEAGGKYENCDFDEARAILNRALEKAKCEQHKKSIKEKIKSVMNKKKHEETTERLHREANDLQRKGRYEAALERLQQARNHTTCERYKSSLDEKIARIRGKFDASETKEAQKEQDNGPDCSKLPNTRRAWDSKNNREACFCMNENYRWNRDWRKGCYRVADSGGGSTGGGSGSDDGGSSTGFGRGSGGGIRQNCAQYETRFRTLARQNEELGQRAQQGDMRSGCALLRNTEKLIELDREARRAGCQGVKNIQQLTGHMQGMKQVCR